MNIKTLVIAALVAAGVGSSGSSAHAALAFSTGDVYLGFRASDERGYLVNIGNVSQFTAKNGASFTVNTGGNIGLDLASDSSFTATWHSSETVSWGAVSTTYVDFSTPAVLFATRPRSNPSTQSTPWNGRSNSAQTSTVSSFQALSLKYGVEGNATANSTKATFQGTGENTWAGFTISPSDFNVFPGLEGNFGQGAANSILDFYQINPVNGSQAEYLGYFSITSAGVVTFTAVPEPGTIALISLAAIFALGRLRRRRHA